MCIRDRYQRRVHGELLKKMMKILALLAIICLATASNNCQVKKKCGPSVCSPKGMCTADYVCKNRCICTVDGKEKEVNINQCSGAQQPPQQGNQCNAPCQLKKTCGSSYCSPSGICTMDYVCKQTCVCPGDRQKKFGYQPL
eukprot:TRINITY_DN5555_c0_g1_i5.p1 TRINITY_DN5555_c0_g1~~TRINITY_DN5555_c0_g1_i5.p1  ORF type:complete len:163 (+),score=40.68 TRINITY_DN5555_c0_g1_i5:69-491(+)